MFKNIKQQQPLSLSPKIFRLVMDPQLASQGRPHVFFFPFYSILYEVTLSITS